MSSDIGQQGVPAFPDHEADSSSVLTGKASEPVAHRRPDLSREGMEAQNFTHGVPRRAILRRGTSPSSLQLSQQGNGFTIFAAECNAESALCLLPTAPHSASPKISPHSLRGPQVSASAERSPCVTLGILVLSLYSTFFSAVFLLLAVLSPRYGKRVSADDVLSPSSATVITALLAKSIELSLATAFVGFLGQRLSRRALANTAGRGISVAEMIMRNWTTQPGTLLLQWESVRYAGPTLLGVLSLITAVTFLLYTTAANALVQPQLAFGTQRHVMQSEWTPL